MNLVEALKTGRAIAYPSALAGRPELHMLSSSFAPNTFFEPDYLLSTVNLTRELLLSDKWYVKPVEVKITPDAFWDVYSAAYMDAAQKVYGTHEPAPYNVALRMAERLGLVP